MAGLMRKCGATQEGKYEYDAGSDCERIHEPLNVYERRGGLKLADDA